MIGKNVIKKTTSWLGKTIPKVLNTVEQGNSWLGKEIKLVKQGYSDLKQDVIKQSGILRPLVRELITDLETSPLGQFVSSAVKQAEMRQQQVDDVLQSAKTAGKIVNRFISS